MTTQPRDHHMLFFTHRHKHECLFKTLSEDRSHGHLLYTVYLYTVYGQSQGNELNILWIQQVRCEA